MSMIPGIAAVALVVGQPPANKQRSDDFKLAQQRIDETKSGLRVLSNGL